MKLSLFKTGIIISIIGIVWISVVFLEGDKITEEFQLRPSNSHNMSMWFVGEDIGYYKVFMPEFGGEEMFVQILDKNKNIISEQSIQTKMSIGYFDFNENGQYSIKISNISDNVVGLSMEFGNTNSQSMVAPGVMVLAGAVMIILASYIRLKNYRIAQPDENIS